MSYLNQKEKAYKNIKAWCNKPLESEHPYVYLDGIVLKRSWTGETRNVSVSIAVDAGNDSYRKVLGIVEGDKEDRRVGASF